MAAKVFIVPVQQTAQSWHPSPVAIARSLPGYKKAGALIMDGAAGTRRPWCLMTVFADSFADLDAAENVHHFGGTPQGKLSQYLAHLDGVALGSVPAARRNAIAARLEAIGFSESLAGLSVGDAVRRVMRYLEPAADDMLYEKVVPSIKQTITDSFTGTDGAGLGAGWSAAEGSAWQINTNRARPVDNYAISAMVRSEASFPDDQYVECVAGFFTGDSISRSSPAIRVTTNTYYFCRFSSGFVELYRRNSGTDSYVADAAGTIAVDTTYLWRLEAAGTTLTVDQDGVEKISTTNSSITSGKPGLYAFRQSTYPTVDDFACTDAVAGSSIAAISNYHRMLRRS